MLRVVPLIGSVGGQNVRLETKEGAYLLKIADHDIVATETWACAWAFRHHVLAPEIVATDPDGNILGRPHLVLGWRDGTEPLPGKGAVVEAGRQVCRLHATSIQGYGPVSVTASGVAEGKFATWSDYIDSVIAKGSELAKFELLDPAVSVAARRALGAVSSDLVFEQPGAVLHGDLHLRHLLTLGERLTGILDWADASVGDPIMDFAAFSRDGEEALGGFMRGYGLEMSSDIRRKIVAYRLLSTIDTLWFEWRSGGDWFDAYRDRIASDVQLLASYAADTSRR